MTSMRRRKYDSERRLRGAVPIAQQDVYRVIGGHGKVQSAITINVSDR
jgi:predicted RNA-binding protein YlqC (UPF0109 family)